MIIIEDVVKIQSSKGTMVLKTKSGIDICIEEDSGPNYIDICTYVAENGQDLVITVAINWDSCNIGG